MCLSDPFQITMPSVNYNCLPEYNGSWSTYEAEVKLWTLATKLEEQKRGPAIILSLPLKSAARTLASSLDAAEIVKDTGVQLVLDTIKPLYEADSVDLKYRAMVKLERLKREESADIMKYILDFEAAFMDVKNLTGNDPYSDELKAFILIWKANLSPTNERIVRSSIDKWEYKDAVNALKKIFGPGSQPCRKQEEFLSDKIEVKEEQVDSDVHYNHPYNKGKHHQKNNYKKNHYTNKSSNSKQRDTSHVLCFVCKKKGHYCVDCPMVEGNSKEIHHVSEEAEDASQYSLNHAVLDSGAAKTVVGYRWLSCYERDSQIYHEKLPTSMMFRFGDSLVESKEKFQLQYKSFFIEVYLVDVNVPLLFSLETMRMLMLKLNFEEDFCSIDGQKIQLKVTERGHYLLPLLDVTDVSFVSPLRLHRVFGHASSNKIISTLRAAERSSPELEKGLKELDEKCDFCLDYKRNTSRPRVSITLAVEFNELVCVDLKEIEGTLTLQIIDSMTRFSLAGVIEDKSGETVTNAFITIWIGIFGPPRRLLSDVGGEFVNFDDFNEMCDMFAISHTTTAGYSPFSNGVVERHNGIIAQMVKALIDDLNIDLTVALSWCIQAKNNLLGVQGFSPAQLVFGSNTKVPDYSNIKEISQMKETCKKKYLVEKVNAMLLAREKMLKAESSMKLKRALKSKVENSQCTHYLNNDRVYFRRELKEKNWTGPGRVVGQLGSIVVILYGGLLIRVHHTKVKLRQTGIEEMNTREKEIIDDRLMQVAAVNASGSGEGDKTMQHDQQSKEIPETGRGDVDKDEFSSDDDEPSMIIGEPMPVLETEETAHTDPVDEVLGELPEVSEGSDSIEPGFLDHGVDSGVTETTDQDSSVWVDRLPNQKGMYTLSSGEKLRYRIDDEYHEVEVLNRAYKTTSSRKNTFNVKDDDGERSLNLDVVDSVEVSTINYVMMESAGLIYNLTTEERIKENEGIQEAKKVEIESLQKFGVYEEVRKGGQRAISSRWVITEKLSGNQRRYKARLVARGFEEPILIQSDSPTVEKSTIRLFFAVCASRGWRFESLDIKSAFLQSTTLDRTIFIIPPRDIRKSGVIWRLIKPLYGVNDSGRIWYFTICCFLITIGCVQSVLDKALFMFYCPITRKLIGILLIHVDDFLYAGTAKFKNEVIKKIIERFEISKMSDGCFIFIGWNLVQADNKISVDQIGYAKTMTLHCFENQRRKQRDDALTSSETTAYQAMVGQLNWLACQTRPDIKFDVLTLSTSLKNPTVDNMISCNKIIQKAQSKEVKIVFNKLQLDSVQIILFTDASWANMPDGKGSARGHAVLLYDTQSKIVNVISWTSNKVARVVHATFDSETLSLLEGLQDAIFIRALLSEILYSDRRSKLLPIVAFTDSKQLHSNLYSTRPCKNKRLRIDIAEIVEMINTGVINEVIWLPAELQLADVLTKASGPGSNGDYLNNVLESGLIPFLQDEDYKKKLAMM